MARNVGQFFKDDKGNFSMMRLLTFLIVCSGLYIIIFQAMTCGTVDWTGCISLITTGLVGKYAQKTEEGKKETHKTINYKPNGNGALPD